MNDLTLAQQAWIDALPAVSGRDPQVALRCVLEGLESVVLKFVARRVPKDVHDEHLERARWIVAVINKAIVLKGDSHLLALLAITILLRAEVSGIGEEMEAERARLEREK